MSNNVNGQRVQAVVDKILHCIIHKPVLGNAADSIELWAGNAYPNVAAKPLSIGSYMPSMLSAFVDNFKLRRTQAFSQATGNCRRVLGCGGGQGVRGGHSV